MPSRVGPYRLPWFVFADFHPRDIVLDVGCGDGNLLRDVPRGIGLDVDHVALRRCAESGLKVAVADVTHLPIRTGSVDGVICKVTLPLTDDTRTLAEIARVLKPEGRATISCMGAGYYLHYALFGPSAKRRFYGLCALINTWGFWLTGRRLVSNTSYETARRLRAQYQRHGLILEEDQAAPRLWGLRVMFYHRLLRRSADDDLFAAIPCSHCRDQLHRAAGRAHVTSQ